MLAEKDKTIERAVSSAWQMTKEEIIRERMRNREEGEMMWRSIEEELAKKDALIRELTEKLKSAGQNP